MTEERTVSATGGEKGRKPAELGSVDPQALLVLAEVSGFGARKYAAFNYLKGYDWSLSFNAMQRHALAFWAGEDTDPESGLPHMGHAAWHALALVSFLTRGLGTDDRFKQEPSVTTEEATPQQWAEIVTQHPWLRPELEVGRTYRVSDDAVHYTTGGQAWPSPARGKVVRLIRPVRKKRDGKGGWSHFTKQNAVVKDEMGPVVVGREFLTPTP